MDVAGTLLGLLDGVLAALDLTHLLSVMIGGTLAILGGIVGTYVQTRLRYKSRIHELVAEARVPVCAESYKFLKTVATLLDRPQPVVEEALKLAREFEGAHFWSNRLWIPDRVCDHFLELRHHLDKACSLRDHPSRDNDHIVSALRSTNMAIEAIYDQFSLRRLNPKAD